MMAFDSLHAGGVALPVSPWIVKGLHMVTLTTHVAVMNILLGTALLYAVGLYVGGDKGATAPKLPIWMAFTINTGVAPLLFCQALLAHYIYTSSILIAGWWLGAVFILIAAYYLSYLATSAEAVVSTRRLAATAIALLLLFVSFIFVCNIDLMTHPVRWNRYFDSPHGWLLFTGGADTLLRWAHVVLAALFHALLLGRILGKADWLAGKKGRWLGGSFLLFLFATGIAHHGLLPATVKHMAGDGILDLTLLIISAGVLALVYVSGRLKLAGLWACSNLTLMILFREDIRSGFLAPVTNTGPADYGSFTMFVLSLVLGGAALGYMVSLLRKGGGA
ncbi:hypothetical protein DSLASN_03240 [Desulfoluna limicola]|uniref:Uncharacterized protein n=1 Tax=Desulfoluna limicola TaxID=2810562 RepID=A0ABM7PC99_9BACT|nr:hypothetical protein [Desulfoluna limicola]BCS94692.1 hypothetical protein DSLASN_03240 [Desulfoluna limicola]